MADRPTAPLTAALRHDMEWTMSDTDQPTVERIPLAPAHNDPPYDDSEPCMACPGVLRNLFAQVHNVLGAFEHAEWERLGPKMADLRRTYDRDIKPLSEAHFADPMHSHGHLPPKPRTP